MHTHHLARARRAVRLFIERHLERLRGRRLLLDENNQAVVYIVHSLTSKSHELMAELSRTPLAVAIAIMKPIDLCTREYATSAHISCLQHSYGHRVRS